MARSFSRRNFLAGVGALGAAGLLSSCAVRTDGGLLHGIPKESVWSTYAVGTGTYNDVAAIANAFTNEYGIQVRLLASGTGIGRLGPIITGTTELGRTGVEYYYAFEAEDEYCTDVWGPQKVRLLWTPGGNYGILVRRDSGIEKVEDLRGKRVPHVVGNTSVNRYIQASLAYGGLTYDDVNVQRIGYSEQANGMKTGHIDVMFENPTGTAVQELASEYPIRWMDFSDDSPERFREWPDIVPMVSTSEFSGGAGMDEGETVTNMAFSIPFVASADADDDQMYAFVSLLHDAFDAFENTTQSTPDMAVDKLLLDPLVTPVHEGALRFFKEKGIWTPDLERRNAALLDRERLLHEAWGGFWEEHGNSPDVLETWKKWKKENLPDLPPVNDYTPAARS